MANSLKNLLLCAFLLGFSCVFTSNSYAASAKDILDAYHLDFSNQQSAMRDLGALFDCKTLLTPNPYKPVRSEKPKLERAPDDRNLFEEGDSTSEFIFVGTNDDFYKISSIVLSPDGSHLFIHGYLFTRTNSNSNSIVEIELFQEIDRAASPSLVRDQNQFERNVKVADLLRADEIEIKIDIENFEAKSIASFLKKLIAKLN